MSTCETQILSSCKIRQIRCVLKKAQGIISNFRKIANHFSFPDTTKRMRYFISLNIATKMCFCSFGFHQSSTSSNQRRYSKMTWIHITNNLFLTIRQSDRLTITTSKVIAPRHKQYSTTYFEQVILKIHVVLSFNVESYWRTHHPRLAVQGSCD